jgi:DNA-binding CsgD family transcriptional regulator
VRAADAKGKLESVQCAGMDGIPSRLGKRGHPLGNLVPPVVPKIAHPSITLLTRFVDPRAPELATVALLSRRRRWRCAACRDTGEKRELRQLRNHWSNQKGRLTEAELRKIDMLVEAGQTDVAIARTLQISPIAVRFHRLKWTIDEPEQDWARALLTTIPTSFANPVDCSLLKQARLSISDAARAQRLVWQVEAVADCDHRQQAGRQRRSAEVGYARLNALAVKSA